MKEYNSAYRINHKEIEKTRKERWVATRGHLWKEKKNIASRISQAKWRIKNRDKLNKAARIYRQKNKDAMRIKAQNRRARKKQNGGKLSKDIASRLYNLQKGRCACCGKKLGSKYHMDHIVPIAKGGPNEDRNIQLLRAECNIKKSAKDPIDFMQSRGFLI